MERPSYSKSVLKEGLSSVTPHVLYTRPECHTLGKRQRRPQRFRRTTVFPPRRCSSLHWSRLSSTRAIACLKMPKEYQEINSKVCMTFSTGKLDLGRWITHRSPTFMVTQIEQYAPSCTATVPEPGLLWLKANMNLVDASGTGALHASQHSLAMCYRMQRSLTAPKQSLLLSTFFTILYLSATCSHGIII